MDSVWYPKSKENANDSISEYEIIGGILRINEVFLGVRFSIILA